MKKVLFKWNELKATFWFVPIILMICSILLSIGLVYLDGQITFSRSGLARFFLVSSSDSARTILSTISAAMIGVAGTVFSVTLVALTLASSQFGPRLIKNFMYVRLNQIVLGSYISTYLYCLLVLNAILDTDGHTFIPSISILVSIIAAILNIVLLIVFIHQIATSIQADHVIAGISVVLSNKIESMFPEKLGQEKENKDEDEIDKSSFISTYSKSIPLNSHQSGYLQYINLESLVTWLADHEALVELHYRPGGFLVEGIELGTLHTNKEWEESDFKHFCNQFVIGRTKTIQQDLEFSLQQMVEIAARALSPGVNDPFTAITCIDNLTVALSKLARAKFPSKYRFDKEENLRVIARTLDFEGALNASFNQIRQFSAGSPAVIIRLMEALIIIHGIASKKRDKDAIIRHAEMVLRLAKENIIEKNDIDDLVERSNLILK